MLSSQRSRSLRWLIAALLALAMLVAACGEAPDEDTAADDPDEDTAAEEPADDPDEEPGDEEAADDDPADDEEAEEEEGEEAEEEEGEAGLAEGEPAFTWAVTGADRHI